MKRANGTGSITKLPGNRRKPWVVKESFKDDKGFPHQRVLGTFETRKAAQEWLEAYNVDKARGTAPPPGFASVTIGQLWEAWRKRELADAPKSKIVCYTVPWDRRLSQYAGRKIRDMRTDEWQEIIDADVKAGLSTGSVSKLKLLMAALSKYAVERDYIAKDYVQFVRMPEHKPVVEKGSLTHEQLEKLAQMAADGVPWADTVLMLCYTGFRIDEFLSLRVADYCPEYGGYLTGGEKTDAGRGRIVPIHPKVAPYFAAWMEKGREYIITGSKGGKLTRSNYSTHHLKPIMAALGIPQASPHWCRHTFATISAEAGVDEGARKRIMGHAMSGDMTAHYTHLGPAFLAAEMAKIP